MKINRKKIEFNIFRFFEKTVQFIGFGRIKYLAKIIAALFYYLIPLRKKVVLKNLRLAFPEKSKKQINKIAFGNYVNVATVFLELLYASKISSKELEEKIIIEEKDRTKILYFAKNQKGAIFLTGHYGNWELLALYIGSLVNNIKPLNILVKNQSNEFITEWLYKVRGKFGSKIVTVGKSSNQLMKIAMGNEIVALIADQRGKREGMNIKFFGIDTPVHTGLAVISLKTKTPILFIVASRTDDGKYKINLEEIKCEEGFSERWKDNVKCIMQNYMSKIEENIRKYPEQWFWMHNIWKYSR